MVKSFQSKETQSTTSSYCQQPLFVNGNVATLNSRVIFAVVPHSRCACGDSKKENPWPPHSTDLNPTCGMSPDDACFTSDPDFFFPVNKRTQIKHQSSKI
ncbi:hypothetical protein ILYODFUR_037530 [Ilyodon furcidens]|uniref:Uncharacterized protein n=1 Tax=Ilyodon furcidens TaxID=33524 RepID=A0ABV0T3T5_9TELE